MQFQKENEEKIRQEQTVAIEVVQQEVIRQGHSMRLPLGASIQQEVFRQQELQETEGTPPPTTKRSSGSSSCKKSRIRTTLMCFYSIRDSPTTATVRSSRGRSSRIRTARTRTSRRNRKGTTIRTTTGESAGGNRAVGGGSVTEVKN